METTETKQAPRAFDWIGSMCAAVIMSDRKRREPTIAPRSASMIDRTFARNDRTHAENMRQARSVARRPSAPRMIERSAPIAAPIEESTSDRACDVAAHEDNLMMMLHIRCLLGIGGDLPDISKDRLDKGV